MQKNIKNETIINFSPLFFSYKEAARMQPHNDSFVYKNIMTYAKSFADVSVGETLLYTNSLDHMAVAINQGSFAKAYNVGSGTAWKITIRRAPKVIYD